MCFNLFLQRVYTKGVYEIVLTSHGHTILEWDACCKEWISVKLCATPDDMAEMLIEHLTNYLEYKATLERRELTENDLTQVKVQRQKYIAKLR